MKLMKISAGGDCRLIQQLTLPQSTGVASLAGVTGFVWRGASDQFITWPSGSQAYLDSDKSASFVNC